MARYEDVLVGGEGLRDDIQDLRRKLVERERLSGLLLLRALRLGRQRVFIRQNLVAFASTSVLQFMPHHGAALLTDAYRQ